MADSQIPVPVEGKEAGFFGNLLNGTMRGIKGLTSGMESFHLCSDLLHLAQPGDLIEIQGKSYSNYALYIGDGKVITVDAEENAIYQDNMLTEARVLERTLEEACKDHKARVRNHDALALSKFESTAGTPEEIIRAAMYYKDKHVAYEFDARNCEYYCTLWRYGVGFSTQAAKASGTILGSFMGARGNQDGYDKYKKIAITSSSVLGNVNPENGM